MRPFHFLTKLKRKAKKIKINFLLKEKLDLWTRFCSDLNQGQAILLKAIKTLRDETTKRQIKKSKRNETKRKY